MVGEETTRAIEVLMPILQSAMTALIAYVAKLLHDLRADVDTIKDDMAEFRADIARAQEWRRNHEEETDRVRSDNRSRFEALERAVFYRPLPNGGGK